MFQTLRIYCKTCSLLCLFYHSSLQMKSYNRIASYKAHEEKCLGFPGDSDELPNFQMTVLSSTLSLYCCLRLSYCILKIQIIIVLLGCRPFPKQNWKTNHIKTFLSMLFNCVGILPVNRVQ